MRAFLVVAIALAAACGGSESDTSPIDSVPQPVLSDIQGKIFTPSCAAFSACHNPAGQAGKCDLTAGKAWAELVNQQSHTNPSHILVVPGKPEESFLMKKLRGQLGKDDGEAMPLRNPSLSEEQIGAVEAWIASGANND